MSSPIPPVVVTFGAQGDDAIVRAAKRVQSELDRTSQTAANAAAGADTMAAGFRRAAQQLDAVSQGAQSWVRGLQALEAQQTQAAQAAARLARGVSPIAAAMGNSASGTSRFAEGLRVLKAQQEASAAAAAKGTAAVHPMAAAMAQSASGTAKWEEGLRRLAQQQKQSAEITRTQQGGITSLAESLKGLVTVYTALRVARFVGDALEAAASLHELSQRTGATVETLSTLEFAGRRAGVGADEIAVAFKGLSLSLGQLRDGGSDAVDAFQSIGISAQDLKGLSVDQVFLHIVDALNRLPAGFDKAEAASKIFGRSGSALIPLLTDLANDGFKKAGDDARRFNAIISEDGATSADAFKDALGDLKGALDGLARETAGPMLPGLTKLVELLEKGAALIPKVAALWDKTPNPLALMPGVGPAIEMLRFGFKAAAASDTRTSTSTPKKSPSGPPLDLPVTEKQIEALVKLRTEGRATAADMALIRKAIAQLNAEMAKTADPIRRSKVSAQLESLQSALQHNPVRDAQLAARKEAIKQRLSAEQQGVKAEDELNSARYAQGLETLNDYYAKRKQAVIAGMNAEMAALVQQLAIVEERKLKGTTEADRQADAVTRKAEADAIRAQMVQANDQAAQQVQALTDEQVIALRALTDQRLQAEQEVQTAQGNTFQAALLGIQQQIQKRRELLAKDGSLTPEQRDSDVQKLQRLLTLRAQAAEVERQVGVEMAAMDRDRERIQNLVTTGKLTEKDGAKEIASLELQRLPTLQRMADEAMRLAAAIGDPALVEQAQALGTQLGTIAAQADIAGQQTAQFIADTSRAVGEGVGSLLTDGFSKLGQVTSTEVVPAIDKAGNIMKDRFGNTIEKVTTDVYDLGDAFMDMARRVVQSLEQIASQSIGNTIAGVFGGLFTKPMMLATGGMVPGSGSGDIVPAMLEPGEMVINKVATARHFGLLAEINGGALNPARPVSYGRQHFATGGLVTTASGRSVVELLVPDGFHGQVHSEDDTVRVVIKHKRTIAKALGVNG